MRLRHLSVLSAAVLSLTLLSPTPAAQAATPDKHPLLAGITCEASRDVSSLFQDAVLDQHLYGYNSATGSMGVLPETASINEYSYVIEDFTGRLVNDGTLKAGDFFTYQLDPAARLGGFQSARSVRVNDLVVTDENGNPFTLATASFDYETNRITYTLTSFIEGRAEAYVENSEAYLVKPDVVPNNGVREFTNEFAGTTNTFSYNVDYRGNVPNVTGSNTYSFFSAILEVDRTDKSYTQIFYLDPQGAELPDGFSGGYLSTDNTTPFGPNAKITAYKLPENYVFPDTFGVDFTALAGNDVTAEVVNGSTISVPGPTSDRYVFKLVNNYISNTTVNANGNEVETINTINSGINIDAMAAPNTRNHLSRNRILEQTYSSTGVADGVGELDPSVCDVPRTITVEKTSSVDGSALAGAVFDVKKDGQTVATLTTDENGIAVSEQLPFGAYELVEVHAPAGYELASTPVAFELSRTSPVFTYSIAVENTPKVPETVEPPAPNGKTPPRPVTRIQPVQALAKTGSDSLALGVAATLLAAAGTTVLLRRKGKVDR